MEQKKNYLRIEKAIMYLIDHQREQPSLDEVARVVGMSKYHFQRIFTEWAGISPKQFVEHLTVEALKEELFCTRNLLEASDRVGLSAQSRAYDLMVNIEAMTPGEYKQQGHQLLIRYGVGTTPFGLCFIATTERGICLLEFIDEDFDIVEREMKDKWSRAEFRKADEEIERLCQLIFYNKDHQELRLLLKGTPFQIKVWRALLSLPTGTLASYQDIAKRIGNASGVRAVASAIAKNPVGYIIPCHRVIRNQGVVGEYHWRKERKISIIGRELAHKKEIILEEV